MNAIDERRKLGVVTIVPDRFKELLVIQLEARLQPNIRFTFERAPYAQFYRFLSAKFHEI